MHYNDLHLDPLLVDLERVDFPVVELGCICPNPAHSSKLGDSVPLLELMPLLPAKKTHNKHDTFTFKAKSKDEPLLEKLKLATTQCSF